MLIINEYKNAFNFSGVSTRRQFWTFLVYHIILSAGLVSYGMSIIPSFEALMDNPSLIERLNLMMLVFMAHCVALTSLSIRRLNDIGFNGLWFLLAFIPVIGTIPFLILMARKSQREQ